MAKAITTDTEFDPYARQTSTSQIGMLIRCEEQWVQRYVYKIRPPMAPFFAIGLSVDEAANGYNKVRKESGRKMSVGEVVEIARAHFEVKKESVVDWGEEKPETLPDEIAAMTEVLYRNSLIVHEPVDYQRKLVHAIGDGWTVVGYLDVETKPTFETDVDELLASFNGLDDVKVERRDYKTANKPWFPSKEYTEIQPVIYWLDVPDVNTLFHWDIVVREDGPRFETRTRMITVAEKRGFRDLFLPRYVARVKRLRENPSESLPTGYGSFVCSRSRCAFWEQCEAKHGLRIKDDG